MNLGKVIQLAWRGLISNKLRSLLTMLGVIIGVAAVIIMIAISAGTEKAISDQITGLGSNLLFVNANFSRGGFGGGKAGGGSSSGLTYDDAYAIVEEVSGVAAMVVEMPTSQTVKAGSNALEDLDILGTTSAFPSVRDMTVANGRFYKDTDVDRKQKVAVLGSKVAEELFGEETAVGQTVTIDTTKFTVIGVMEEKGVVSNVDFDSRIYIPITVVFQKFVPSQFARVMGDSVRTITVEAAEDAVLDDVILQIELLLAKRHDVTLDEPDFAISTQQDFISAQESTTETFRNLLAWVAAVSLVVGGIGIMNIMLVSVTERTREIGIRQSVGATPGDIRAQFLTEALLLSLMGGVIGVAAGAGGSYIFNVLGEIQTVIVPSSIILAFSSAAGVGIFFGFYPANKAAQLDPIDALRHE